MNDVNTMFKRHADWQRARARLSWPEKIRQAEAMRNAVRLLRTRPPAPRPPST